MQTRARSAMPSRASQSIAVLDVVDHAAAELAVAALDEIAAIAGRAAEIRLEHGIAAAGEELHLRVEDPAVAQERPAVRQDDQRQVPRSVPPARQRQIAVDDEAVAAAVADRPDRGEAQAVEPFERGLRKRPSAARARS